MKKTESLSSAKKAARFGFWAPILAILIGFVVRSTTIENRAVGVVIGLLILILIVAGFLCSITGIISRLKRGTKGVLVYSSIGFLLNGFFLGSTVWILFNHSDYNIQGSGKIITSSLLPGETASGKEDSMRMAFMDSDPSQITPVDEKTRQGAEEFIIRLKDAIEQKDREALADLFSYQTMADLLESSEFVTFPSKKVKRDFERGMRIGLANTAATSFFSGTNDDIELVQVQPLTPDRIIVYVRSWIPDLEIYSKLRYWLILNPASQAWEIYDFEDLDSNLRASVLMGAFLSNGDPTENSWFIPFNEIVQKIQSWQNQDLLTLQAEMKPDVDLILNDDSAPMPVTVFALINRANHLIVLEEYEEALAVLDTIDNMDPTTPIIHYLRGLAYSGQGDWNSAALSYTMYGDLLGWDSDVYELLADVRLSQGDQPAAAELSRKGLEENPRALGCLMTFAISASEENWKDVTMYIQATADPEFTYEVCIDYALDTENLGVAEHLFASLEASLPDSDLLPYYRAVLP